MKVNETGLITEPYLILLFYRQKMYGNINRLNEIKAD